ncbi:hypothetical protein HXX76_012508 [Chlamydomonas incerta]|uniref:Polymerase nucleotidyl transferase domain-containing protein n=1 Tax=Chlamydomonas incerta TaxID=51695 RepID=A0A835SHK8_CHLIN|nr:hypothetical protein HXX76_012508 [Chlamydomonas incerta]|eukprot:KAG2427313.1 hypothetical protein HXX76_012508 [Chlamydomonas incerta]
MGCACGAAVEVVSTQVHRAHIGGSFGRRTLVSGAFDVDVLMFVFAYGDRTLTYQDWTGEAGERLQRDMQRAVAAYLRAQGLRDVVEVEYGTHYKHCINVKVHGVDMDIKMAANVLQGAWASRAGAGGWYRRRVACMHAAQQLTDADPAREAALAESLTKAVKAISDRVKFVARLVKCWYKGSLAVRIPHVPSVLLEVLTLAAAQSKGLLSPSKKSPGAEVAVLVAALELLDAAVSRREVVLLEAGPVWGYTRQQALGCAHVWDADPVVVLHPIDPTCNLAAAAPGRAVDWGALAAEARALRRVVREQSMLDLVTGSSLARAIKVQLAP